MKPFVITYKKEFLKDKSPKEVLERFKLEFKNEADPERLIIKNNLLLIENSMPYKKSLRLINNIDKLEIIYYPEGILEYKIYLYGFHIILTILSIAAGIFLNSIIIGIFIFSIIYLSNFIVIGKHKRFMNKKIKELQTTPGCS